MTPHLADIICGTCGHVTRIQLGMASAIVCSGCGTEITLGEPEKATDDQWTGHLARMGDVLRRRRNPEPGACDGRRLAERVLANSDTSLGWEDAGYSSAHECAEALVGDLEQDGAREAAEIIARILVAQAQEVQRIHALAE